ncbi:hypothetical protein OsI_22671 [Oryza sativa Indica Group]|uniref:Uncharacterized protein n=1 Tax=Oryza sativa subsp. indica TaxID=39946 RepID=B8B0X8_ORYSI|nr:hypothetical protein OsI_22671 [Oryza sativa Indica Group]
MEVLLPLLLACSLLFTIATPIRDITDVCASQISDFQPLLAGATPLRPPLLRRRHPRRRPHRPPRLAPRQQPPDIAVVIVSPPRPPQEEGRRRRRLAGVVVIRAADAGRVGGRRQLRDPPGPRHAGDLLRDGGRHGVVAHLAAVLPVLGVVPPAGRSGVRPARVGHVRRRAVLLVGVRRAPGRHAQPLRLLRLQRLHLPGQLRRQLLLRRLPQQGHRLLRLRQLPGLLLRLRPRQRGPLRPLRGAHRPRQEQALAALPASPEPRLRLLLLPPDLVGGGGLPLHRLVQPRPVLVHAHGVQLPRRLALLRHPVGDLGRRGAARRAAVGVPQPADDHRLRHGDHAAAAERVHGAEQGRGRGHSRRRAAGADLLHPGHLLPGLRRGAARPARGHGVRRRRDAGAVPRERAHRRRRLHDVPGVRADRRHGDHREHAAADVQRGVRRRAVQDRLRRRRLQLRTQTAAGRLKLGKRAMLLLLLLPPPPISAQAQK